MNSFSNTIKPFHVIQSNMIVKACSSVRLPFEPKGWMIDFRSNLRSAVSKLSLEGGALHAKYGSVNGTDFADTENVLFYNVGASAFSNIASNEILFERLSPEITKSHISSLPYGDHNYAFFYSYEVVSAGQHHLQYQDDLIAEWKDVKISKPSSVHKPLHYWRTLHNNPAAVSIYAQSAVYQPFGLDISFTAPKSEETNLTAIMKPMLDGVICAFHSYKEPLDSSFDVIKAYLNCPRENLINLEFGILGKEKYVYEYRNGIKWNPDDDRCNKVRLSVQYCNTNDWSFSGKVFMVQ